MNQPAPAALPGWTSHTRSSLALERIFKRAFHRLGLDRLEPAFHAEFYPFRRLHSTVRLDGDTAAVRVTDVLAGAPEVVLDAVAEILLTRIFRRSPSREARECYLEYVMRPSVRRRIDGARRLRSRAGAHTPRGRCFDLQAIFARLNRRFFNGRISVSGITWSRRTLRSVLGHFDSGLGTITINRRLDSPRVPRSVVEYLVFHEMLHVEFPVRRNGHRRIVHSEEFRSAERNFPAYVRAARWLKARSLEGDL